MSTASLHYMTLALQLAEQGRYTASPNPMVGCVIVKNNRIIGQGFHQIAGGPHAESIALQQAGSAAKNATAYVSLEPCCHVGRTPPCTQALIRTGIKKVYIACEDPNPHIAGKGILELQSAGIEVELGLCADKARALNEIFFHYITHKRPFVIAKWAMSLDGKTITHKEDINTISCTASREHSHQLRQQVDAILIGAKTARKDNPQLTTRYFLSSIQQKHPLRIILSRRGNLPLHLNVFNAALPGKTLLATTTHISPAAHKKFTQKNIEVLILPENSTGEVELNSLLQELGKREISSLLVEGGMQVHQSFMRENLINQIQVYLAPVLIGSLNQKRFLNNFHHHKLATDLYLTANV